jgi:hypothetical protein
VAQKGAGSTLLTSITFNPSKAPIFTSVGKPVAFEKSAAQAYTPRPSEIRISECRFGQARSILEDGQSILPFGAAGKKFGQPPYFPSGFAKSAAW